MTYIIHPNDIDEPWHFEKDGHEVYVVGSNRLHRVCTMERPGFYYEPKKIERLARLVAAAPTLAKTLIQVSEITPRNSEEYAIIRTGLLVLKKPKLAEGA